MWIFIRTLMQVIMQFIMGAISGIVQFVGFIFGSFILVAGALSLMEGHSGMPILYGFGIIAVSNIIGNYIQSKL